jgi:putative spermidine/putrescine transport system ATP-binding protein
MTTLTFDNVHKSFGSTVALEEFCLDVREGELISLLGPSGCGKTTALRVAAGFEIGDRGSVHLFNRDISRVPAHKRNMGMVFQSYSLFPNLSVAQNVEFGLRTRKVASAERRKRTVEVLQLVQLESQANRYPHQLSGGQQQRVALARALAVRPDVLLLDEPLSALDAKVRSTLRDEIRRIQSELGITTLFVTHDQDEALAISDRIAVMSDGRIDQLGTPLEVYRQPTSAFVARFIGSMNELQGCSTGSGRVEIDGRSLSIENQLPSGTEVTILVRPEDTRIELSGYPGTVVSVHFQGSSTRVSVRLDRLDVLVDVHGHASDVSEIQPGDRTAVGFDWGRALCESKDPGV